MSCCLANNLGTTCIQAHVLQVCAAAGLAFAFAVFVKALLLDAFSGLHPPRTSMGRPVLCLHAVL